MRTAGKILIGLGCGIAAGAVLGILYAPDKGTETRRKISEATDDFTDRLKTAKDGLTGRVKVVHNGHGDRKAARKPEHA